MKTRMLVSTNMRMCFAIVTIPLVVRFRGLYSVDSCIEEGDVWGVRIMQVSGS